MTGSSVERSQRRATAAALAGLGREWTVVHDLAWPGRSLGRIDHVVVGPPGVFVVEDPEWTGAIAAGGALRRHGHGRSRSAAVTGVRDAARAVAGLVGSPAIAVLSFPSDAVAPTVVDGVLVVGAQDVVRALTTFEPALTEERRAAVVALLPAGPAHASPRRPVAVAEPPAKVAVPTAQEPAEKPVEEPAALPGRESDAPRTGSARRSAPLVPATRLKRSSLPVGSSSSGSRSRTRRLAPRLVAGVLAAALVAAMVVPVSREWVSDRIYQMVSPDIPVDPGPVQRPAEDRRKPRDQRPGQGQSQGQNRPAAASDAEPTA